jgi:hypothetical protein
MPLLTGDTLFKVAGRQLLFLSLKSPKYMEIGLVEGELWHRFTDLSVIVILIPSPYKEDEMGGDVARMGEKKNIRLGKKT